MSSSVRRSPSNASNASQFSSAINADGCLFQPPVDLLFDAIEHDHINTYGYLISILHDAFKTNRAHLSRLLRTALRCSNTVDDDHDMHCFIPNLSLQYFLQCLFTMVTIEEFTQLIDSNIFISDECLAVLSTLENDEGA